MSDMFNNYPQPADYIPNNRECKCCCDEQDTIIVNGTTVHTFKLNFSFSELCESFEVIYKSGLNDIITINSLALGAPFEIIEEDGKTNIIITLSPDNTQVFSKFRDAYVQMKLYMKDKTVIYGDLNKLTVIETLNNNVDTDGAGKVEEPKIIKSCRLIDGVTSNKVALIKFWKDLGYQVKGSSFVLKEVKSVIDEIINCFSAGLDFEIIKNVFSYKAKELHNDELAEDVLKATLENFKAVNNYSSFWEDYEYTK